MRLFAFTALFMASVTWAENVPCPSKLIGDFMFTEKSSYEEWTELSGFRFSEDGKVVGLVGKDGGVKESPELLMAKIRCYKPVAGRWNSSFDYQDGSGLPMETFFGVDASRIYIRVDGDADFGNVLMSRCMVMDCSK